MSALPSTLNSQDITVELQSVPQEIRHNLEEAAALGDIEKVNVAVKQIRGINPLLADKLDQLATTLITIRFCNCLGISLQLIGQGVFMGQKDLSGQKLGDYHLEKILGRGSVATVYKAKNAQGEPVAFKLLTPKFGIASEAVRVRFQREAETMARLNHPNIIRVLDSGHINGNAYMAMAYVKSKNLETLFEYRNRFKPLVITKIGAQIAEALDYAGKEGVVHRDVKPSNILVSKDNRAYLTDFGIAHIMEGPQITATGAIIGTAAYISPEQVLHNRKPDGLSDLYSLGVILYRMATGQLPFLDTPEKMMQSHAYDEPPAFKKLGRVPPDLQTIIITAMAKAPTDRYPDGHTMAQALLKLNRKLGEQQNFLQRWWTRVNFRFS